MKEYVERGKILDQAYYHSLSRESIYDAYGVDAVDEDDIKAIPAADVVEVVRCGECMFWDAPPSCEGLARCRTGESGVRFRKAYDFCSRGRKKMDGGVNDGKAD